jgi:hypothetical protein
VGDIVFQEPRDVEHSLVERVVVDRGFEPSNEIVAAILDIANELEIVVAVDKRVRFRHHKDIVIVGGEIGDPGGLMFSR